MFPIMHLVGLKKTLAQQYPWLPATVYKRSARPRRSDQGIEGDGRNQDTLPWPEVYVQDAAGLMAKISGAMDRRERAHIESLTRISFEQEPGDTKKAQR